MDEDCDSSFETIKSGIKRGEEVLKEALSKNKVAE